MFYQKNVPTLERVCRVFIGLVIACAGFFFAPDIWMKWLAIGAGLTAACTGFIGYCPMCALANRQI